MASMYFTINSKCHQHARGFMLMTEIILGAHKAKINWLQAQLAVTEILLKVITGKTVIIIFDQ